MNVRHELEINSFCPVDGAEDVYQVTVECSRVLRVEEILKAVAEMEKPLFQEEVTRRLADDLGVRVTTVGYHSGVKTTCSV